MKRHTIHVTFTDGQTAIFPSVGRGALRRQVKTFRDSQTDRRAINVHGEDGALLIQGVVESFEVCDG